MKKLVVTAHPDDETLFFSSVLDQDTKVICVTDGNADGRGNERKIEFSQALASYDVQDFEMWDFQDIYEQRLGIKELVFRLQKYSASQIYTHSPIGEYGHPHHQDVCRAVYEVFDEKDIWVPSFNAYPSLNNELSPSAYAKKMDLLTNIYNKETSRFINLISVTSTESFLQMAQEEVVSIYNYLTGVSDNVDLTSYKIAIDVFREAYKDRKRIF